MVTWVEQGPVNLVGLFTREKSIEIEEAKRL